MRNIRLPTDQGEYFEAVAPVSELPSVDDLLNKAFHLACFIQGERQAAVRIVANAMIKLGVAATAQDKRLYYKPVGRTWPRRTKSESFRNKVSFNDVHLLQRLVYIESEPYEIQQERGTGSTTASEKDLLIHFIKHLVRTTMKRNSFYVTLGLSRLLYHYSTAETMEIYNAVIQDPDRVKDDYYYRSRKGVLMQEMKKRFGDLLKVCRGAHGEERFQPHDSPSRFAEIVEQSLSAFTPWWTPCLVPATANPVMDGIPQLSYQGHKLEDRIEVNRIHAVLHPNCLSRLIKALGFEAPEQSLEIPYFFMSANGGGDGERRNLHSNLDEDELLSIKRDLDEQSQRRKSASGNLLRIAVDGVERTRLNPNRQGSVDFSLDREAELIEIRTYDKVGNDLLLATHLLARASGKEPLQTVNTSIVLEGGQRLSIAVAPPDELEHSIVTVKYHETYPLRAASLYLRKRFGAIAEGNFAPQTLRAHPVLTTALAVIVLAVCIAGVALFLNRSTGADPGTLVARNEPVGPPAALTQNSPTQVPNQPATADVNRKPAGEKLPTKERSPALPKQSGAVAAEKSENGAESTRSIDTSSDVVPLARVRKIYVEVLGDSPVSQGIRERLIEQIRASNRFAVAEHRAEADALMKVSYRSDTGSVVVQLINARGNIIWPTRQTSSGGKYEGRAATMSRRIIEDLVGEIRGQ